MINDETRRFIAGHIDDDVRKLALHARSIKNINIQLALNQIAGRKTAAVKIPSMLTHSEFILPSRIALEQCSSEITARYKASLLSGGTFADLTGGFGIDFVFIAKNFRHSIYVEHQTELCLIASHNFKTLGLKNTRIENTDSIAFLKNMPQADAIFIDPARRTASGKKTSSIAESEPNLIEIQDLLLEKAPLVLVKLSPMLDISHAVSNLKHVAEIHIVEAGHECKELLFMLKRHFAGEPVLYPVIADATPIPQKYSFTLSQEKQLETSYTSELSEYLYEPCAVFLKAGSFKSITQWFNVQKLHPDSHLFTSGELIAGFPGRIFKIENISSWNKKELKPFLQDITRANLTVRNFPDTAPNLLKRLKISEGGNTFLFATTLADGKHVIIRCTK